MGGSNGHLEVQELSLTLALTAALLMGVLTPAVAGAQPVITVIGNDPGGMVYVRVDNLPANTMFVVTMGPAGSGGIGGLVAHFDTGPGGTRLFKFELHANIRLASTIDMRIDNGAGTYAVTTFENIKLPRPSTQPTTQPTTTPTVPATGGPVVSALTSLQLLNVQKGGWVKVAMVNFPAGKDYTARIGTVATGGLNGSVVGGVHTGTGTASQALFEIPFLFRNEPSLVLRLENGVKSYVLTFANVDK